MNKENLFLVKLFREYKVFFWICVVFIILQAFFMIKRVQNFPFFIYDMYSRHVTIHDTIHFNMIMLDDQEFDYTRLPHWSEQTVLGTFDLYRDYRKRKEDNWARVIRSRFSTSSSLGAYLNNTLTNSSAQYNKYPSWIFNYIDNITGAEAKSNSIEFIDAYYKVDNYELKPINQVSLFRLENNGK